MTPSQRKILRHALYGSGRSPLPYRNHYVSGPDTDSFADCEALVADGLMRRLDLPRLGGGYIYVVTDAGRKALDAPGEREG